MTSSTTALVVTLLVLAAFVAYVRVVRRRTGRVVPAVLVCLLWTGVVVRLHAFTDHVPRDSLEPLLLVLVTGAMTVLVGLHWPASARARLERALGGTLLGAGLGFLMMMPLASGYEAISPWEDNAYPYVMTWVENDADAPVSARWVMRSERGDTNPSWTDAAHGERSRSLHPLLTDASGPNQRRLYPGTLAVRMGDAASIEVPLALAPRTHLAVRVDASGRAWLRTGVEGCFGAPTFDDERELRPAGVQDVPSDG